MALCSAPAGSKDDAARVLDVYGGAGRPASLA